MVNILDQSHLGEVAKTTGSVLVKALIWGGIILIVGAIVAMIIIIVRNKKIYSMPVRLDRLLDNGTKKELNGLKGGKIKQRGVFNFVVKVSPFKKHNLGYMPDFSKTDADNRLVFLSVGDGTLWQQMEEKIMKTEKITLNLTDEEIETQRKAYSAYVDSAEEFHGKSKKEKEELIKAAIADFVEKNKIKTYEYSLIMKPIKTEVKTATLNAMKSWTDILDKNKLKVFTIAIGAFIIMVIAHLVSLYIQTKIRCPTPAG